MFRLVSPLLAWSLLCTTIHVASAQEADVRQHLAHAQTLFTAGKYDDALKAAEESERALGSPDDIAVQADLANLRGRIAERRGLLREAIAHHERELGLAIRGSLKPMMARAYTQLADLSINRGDHARFFEYAQRAFELTPNPDGPARAAYLVRLGVVYEELHETEKADQSFAEAYRLARATRVPTLIASVLTNWGLLYARTGVDPPRAAKYYDEALHVLDGQTSPNAMWALSSLLINSANLFRDTAEKQHEALRRYRAAIAIARRLNATTLLPFALKNMGRVFRMQDRHAEADTALAEAVQLADATDTMRIQWQARMEFGTLVAATDAARAEQYYRQSIDLLEAQHKNVLLEDYSAGALGRDLNTNDNPYELLITLLVQQGKLADAWLVAERARGRVFLDMLSVVREELAARVSPEYTRREREALSDISAQQALLRTGSLAADRQAEVEQIIARNEERLTAMRLQLAANEPDIAHARYPHLLTASELQQRVLAPDEALLEYFVGATASRLWILRPNRMDAIELPGRREIASAVRRYIDAISSPGSSYESESRAIASLLLPNAASLEGVKRLIVVPDGILHYLPFEALLDDRGRFLIERFPISYAPSAASLAFLRSRPAPPIGDVMVIGDATMRKAGAAEERGISSIERVAFLKPLPQAGRELEAVAAAYRGSARVLAREHATEAALAAPDAGRAAILHFATHGLIDEDAPQRSGLALTLAPPSDGILQMREIYRFRLNAALVTLSACQTALGKEITGEGMVGLARAFFFAGARVVMASLWNVNDQSTADFMTGFYAALGQGQSIDEAARTAKLAFLAGDERLRHPYFWAAFVVSGDACAPVNVVRPFPALTIAAVVFVALTAASGIGLVIRRRRPRGGHSAAPVR